MPLPYFWTWEQEQGEVAASPAVPWSSLEVLLQRLWVASCHTALPGWQSPSGDAAGSCST